MYRESSHDLNFDSDCAPDFASGFCSLLQLWWIWTWAIVLPTALRLTASWNWTVANCGLPLMSLLVPFVVWNRFRNGSGFRSVRFLACRYSALQGQPGRLSNYCRRKGKQSEVETLCTAFALRLLGASKKGRNGNSVVFWGELGNIWQRGGVGGGWHISFLNWREF